MMHSVPDALALDERTFRHELACPMKDDLASVINLISFSGV